MLRLWSIAEETGWKKHKEELGAMKNDHWLYILWNYTKTCRGKITASVICAVISVAGGFIPYYATYRLIGLFINNSGRRMSVNDVLFWCLVAALGYLIHIIINAVSTSLSHAAAFETLHQLRLAVANRLYNAPLGAVYARQTGNYKDIILDRIEEIEKPLAHLIPEFSSNLLLPIVVFVWLLTIHPVMGFSILIAPLISLIPMYMLMKDYNSQYYVYMEKNKEVNSVIMEYVGGIEVIKTFNQGTSSYEKYAAMIKNFKDFTIRWFKSTWKDMNLAFAIMPTTLLGVLPAGLILYRMGALAPDQLAIALILSLSIITPLEKLSVFVDCSKPMEYAVMEVNEVLQMQEMKDGEKEIPDKKNIRMSHVSFSYDRKEENNVLNDISLEIPEGSFTALVGPSGGGKSTIARLIARLWDVTDGEIFIGETPICDIRFSALSDAVSYVTQDNFLFDCSLMENIRLGKPDASDDEVIAAAKAARCDLFIDRLPGGYDTPSGEAGKLLSGGEKQRISIARAILKNAPIIIMDEATAFTDPENEYYIQQSISNLVCGKIGNGRRKTLIVIAHRLSTIQNADQIILIDKGRIKALGTHETLLSQSETYRNMWKAHTGAKNWAVGSTAEGRA